MIYAMVKLSTYSFDHIVWGSMDLGLGHEEDGHIHGETRGDWALSVDMYGVKLGHYACRCFKTKLLYEVELRSLLLVAHFPPKRPVDRPNNVRTKTDTQLDPQTQPMCSGCPASLKPSSYVVWI